MSEKINSFLYWWFTGLAYLLPANTREKLWHRQDYITVDINKDHAEFKLYKGQSGKLVEEFEVSLSAVATHPQINDWLNDSDIKIIGLLPKQQLLIKALNYPLASEKEISAVLQHDMDKQTPFSADKVYFDYVIEKRDTETKTISIRLFVILRNKLDGFISQFSSLPASFDRIATNHADEMADINLLPEKNADNDKIILNKTTLLISATVLLFIVALYLPTTRHESILNNLESQVAKSRSNAIEAQGLIDKKEQLLARAEFLERHTADAIPVIDIIKELTNILPDNTWVNRLIIRDGEVQIYGESDAATSLIELIENSDYFQGSQFRSPITKNNASNKDRFHVSANLNAEISS